MGYILAYAAGQLTVMFLLWWGRTVMSPLRLPKYRFNGGGFSARKRMDPRKCHPPPGNKSGIHRPPRGHSPERELAAFLGDEECPDYSSCPVTTCNVRERCMAEGGIRGVGTVDTGKMILPQGPSFVCRRERKD